MSPGATKVGRIDDPIWDQPPPPPPPAPTRRRSRTSVRITVIVVAAMALGGVCALWLAWPSRTGGDPGGRILNQLRPLSAAVPSSATIEYAHYDEPLWDSCDGMAGTFGWDDPVVQINFTWSGSPAALVDHVRSALTASGWSHYTPQVNNGHPGAAWTKRLLNGTTAQAQLAAESYGGWTLYGQAPPVGQRVQGC